MKHNFTVLLLLCISGAINAADADKVVNYKALALADLKQQSKDICEAMTEHCQKGGKQRYDEMLSGHTPGDAMTQVCYTCSQEEFQESVNEARNALLKNLRKSKEEDKKTFLQAFELEACLRVVIPLVKNGHFEKQREEWEQKKRDSTFSYFP